MQAKIKEKEEDLSSLLSKEEELSKDYEVHNKQAADLESRLKENSAEVVRLHHKIREIESVLADAKNE